MLHHRLCMTALLALHILSGMASSSASAATFQFWYALGGRPGAFVQDQCRRFNESQSADVVTCVYQGNYGELLQKTIAAYRAHKQPALIQVSGPAILDMLVSNAIVPVEDLMRSAGQTAQASDLLPAVREAYSTSSGRLIGQPYNVSTLLFFTNETLLSAAGVHDALETWEDVVNAAIKLKANGVGCPMVVDLEPWRILEQFSAVEGLPVATEHDGSLSLRARYVFDKGLNVRFIDDLARWHSLGLIKLPQETRAGSFSAAFDSGECAMIMNSTGAFVETRESIGRRNTIKAHLLPVYASTIRHTTNAGGAGLFVLKGFDPTVLAGVADFLAFLRRPEEGVAMTRATGYLPNSRASLQLLRSDARIPPDLAELTLLGTDSLNDAGFPPGQGLRLGFYVRFGAIYTDEVSKVFAGSRTASEALSTARQRGDELLQRFEQTYPNADLN